MPQSDAALVSDRYPPAQLLYHERACKRMERPAPAGPRALPGEAKRRGVALLWGTWPRWGLQTQGFLLGPAAKGPNSPRRSPTLESFHDKKPPRAEAASPPTPHVCISLTFQCMLEGVSIHWKRKGERLIHAGLEAWETPPSSGRQHPEPGSAAPPSLPMQRPADGPRDVSRPCCLSSSSSWSREALVHDVLFKYALQNSPRTVPGAHVHHHRAALSRVHSFPPCTCPAPAPGTLRLMLGDVRRDFTSTFAALIPRILRAAPAQTWPGAPRPLPHQGCWRRVKCPRQRELRIWGGITGS